MRFRQVLSAVALAAVAAVPAAGQTGEALLKSMASYTPVKNLSFPVPAGDVLKAVWDINAGTEAAISTQVQECGELPCHGRGSRGPALQHKAGDGGTRQLRQEPAPERRLQGVTGWTTRTLPSSRPQRGGVQIIICGQSISNRKPPSTSCCRS
jgi:hypothetical protein